MAKAMIVPEGTTGSRNREPCQILGTGFSKRAGSPKAGTLARRRPMASGSGVCNRVVAPRGPQSLEELRHGAGWRGLDTMRRHGGEGNTAEDR